MCIRSRSWALLVEVRACESILSRGHEQLFRSHWVSSNLDGSEATPEDWMFEEPLPVRVVMSIAHLVFRR